jgi:hypothetical protein
MCSEAFLLRQTTSSTAATKMLLIRSAAVLLALSSSFATSYENNKNGESNDISGDVPSDHDSKATSTLRGFYEQAEGGPRARGRLLLSEKGSLVNDSIITGGSAQNLKQGGDEDADVGILSHQVGVERVLGSLSVGAGSCVSGNYPCIFANYGTVMIGKSSCLGNYACYYVSSFSNGTTTIGDFSCLGNLACQKVASDYAEATTIGDSSCSGNSSCFYVASGHGQATIGDYSCYGNSACSKVAYDHGVATIGHNSCKGHDACAQSASYVNVIIGDNSCKGVKACYVNASELELIIGDNACQCDGCCANLKHHSAIGDGQCNSIDDGCGYSSLPVVNEPVSSEAPSASPSSSPSSSPSASPSTQIFFEGFENGFDKFVDGGSDAAINFNNVYEGDASLRIRDDSGSSVATTATAYDVRAYSELEIDFYYLAIGVETGKRFALDFNDGNGWQVAREWARGTDFFKNNIWSEGKVLFNFENGYWNVGGVPFVKAAFKSSFQFRFRCDADKNNDRIFIDNVTFQGKVGPQIFFEDFENGFDNVFSSGGVDATINFNNVFEGGASLRIRDGTATSVATTITAYDVSAYNELDVDFYFFGIGFETGESFALEFNDGNGWKVAREWVRGGTDFLDNRIWNSGKVTFNFENGSWNVDDVHFHGAANRGNFQFRFRCDADENNDRIFIDNVSFQGK